MVSIQIATIMTSSEVPKSVRAYMSTMGKKRMESMTAEQRTALGKKAAEAKKRQRAMANMMLANAAKRKGSGK